MESAISVLLNLSDEGAGASFFLKIGSLIQTKADTTALETLTSYSKNLKKLMRNFKRSFLKFENDVRKFNGGNLLSHLQWQFFQNRFRRY